MTQKTPRLLMVEDDPEISRLAGDFLRREGFEVETAETGAAMDAALARGRCDLMILDLMLPGGEDGLAICRRLRATESFPILMLSAKGEEIDRVLGLEMGADDYLAKPFGPRELLARVRALLRRAQRPVGAQANRRLAFEGFVIDLDARALEAGGAAVALTTAEFDLLACFVQHPRRVLTRDQILDWTRGRSADPFDRTVDMTISRLRRKLDAAGGSAGAGAGEGPPGTALISTVRNGGYLFTVPVAAVPG